jgi:hypothetical protein
MKRAEAHRILSERKYQQSDEELLVTWERLGILKLEPEEDTIFETEEDTIFNDAVKFITGVQVDCLNTLQQNGACKIISRLQQSGFKLVRK